VSPKPRRVRPDPLRPDQRTRTEHCAAGDVVVFADGRVARVTAFIAGGVFGRWLEGGRPVSELIELPSDPLRLLAGR
jgi:hypothetical protein